jgi:hypothetical protein
MGPKPLKDRAIREGDNPSIWNEFIQWNYYDIKEWSV